MSFELIQIIFFCLFIISVLSFFSIAPWVPTRKRDLQRLEEILKLTPGEKFIEIGCGNARVSIHIAKIFPDSHITGIELSPFFYLISKIRVFFSPYKNIHILYGNAFKHNFSSYDVVYIFGLPDTIKKRLIPKLEKEMKKDTRFISYTFKTSSNLFHEIKHKGAETASIYEYKKMKDYK